LIAEKASSKSSMLAFTGTCAAATFACSAGKVIGSAGLLSWDAAKDFAFATFGCGIAAWFGPMMYKADVMSSLQEHPKTSMFLSGLLPAVGTGLVRTKWEMGKILKLANTSGTGDSIAAVLKTAKALGIKGNIADVLQTAMEIKDPETRNAIQELTVKVGTEEKPLSEVYISQLSTKQIEDISEQIAKDIQKMKEAKDALESAESALKNIRNNVKSAEETAKKLESIDIQTKVDDVIELLQEGKIAEAEEKLRTLKRLEGSEDVKKIIDNLSEAIQEVKDVKQTLGAIDVSKTDVEEIIRLSAQGEEREAIEKIIEIKTDIIKNEDALTAIADHVGTGEAPIKKMIQNLVDAEKVKEYLKGLGCDALGVAAGTLVSYGLLGNASPPTLDVYLPASAPVLTHVSASGNSITVTKVNE